jgi:hypothetical protein
VEREGAISRIVATTRPKWPQPDPQWVEDRFWVWMHYVAGKIVRGEWFEAVDSLAFLRAKVLAPLVAVAEGRDARGVRRFEREMGAYVDGLRATIPGHDAQSCAKALRAVAGQYQALRSRLDSPGLVRREEAERAALAYLDEVLPK